MTAVSFSRLVVFWCLAVAASASASLPSRRLPSTFSRAGRPDAEAPLERVILETQPRSITGSSERKLQTTNYRVYYLGRFQYLRDDNCSGPMPVAEAWCRGTISLRGVTDDSIQCSDADNSADPSWQGIRCVNTCATPEDCAQIFLESVDSESGVWAGVSFLCEGESIYEVDADFTIVGGDAGICSDSTTGGRNFRAAQLGVYCQDRAGEGSFEYNDAFFECGLGSIIVNSAGRYTCYEGRNCQGEACNVEFDSTIVYADVGAFQERCAVSVSGKPVPSAQKVNVLSPVGQYTATFQASWQMAMDDLYCDGSFATKRITCTNGEIELVRTLFSNVECTTVDSSTLDCIDTSATNFVNSFSGIVYQCSATRVPETKVEYLPGAASCNSQFSTKRVQHQLQLGLRCEDEDGPWTSSIDHFFECSDPSFFDTVDGRLTCIQSLLFPPNFEGSATIPSLAISTDYRWVQFAVDDEEKLCHTFLTSGSTGVGTGNTVIAQAEEGPTAAPEPGTNAVPMLPEDLDQTNGGGVDTDQTDEGDDYYYNFVDSLSATEQETTDPPPITEAPTTDPPGVVSTGPHFRATYAGRFQYLLDSGCSGGFPGMFFSCRGSNIPLLTSHESIQCDEPVRTDDGWHQSFCYNTCDVEQCKDIFLEFGPEEFGAGNYGTVLWSCEGDEIKDVDGFFTVGTLVPGTCDLSSTSDGRNYILGQMGVFCSDPGDEGAYEFGDLNFECGSANIPLNVDGYYSCASGKNCGGSACEFEFDTININADLANFNNRCVESLTGKAIPEVPVTTAPPLDTGTYKTAFYAIWSAGFTNDACSGSMPKTVLTCTNGSITLISEPDGGLSCTKVGTNVLECTDSVPADFVGVFQGVIYECAAKEEIAHTRIEFLEGTASCDSSFTERAEHILQLGILCDLESTGQFTPIWLDFFLECGVDDGFDYISGDYTCVESSSVPPGSGGVTIESVEMYTDYRWPLYAMESCYIFEGASTTASMFRTAGDGNSHSYRIHKPKKSSWFESKRLWSGNKTSSFQDLFNITLDSSHHGTIGDKLANPAPEASAAALLTKFDRNSSDETTDGHSHQHHTPTSGNKYMGAPAKDRLNKHSAGISHGTVSHLTALLLASAFCFYGL